MRPLRSEAISHILTFQQIVQQQRLRLVPRGGRALHSILWPTARRDGERDTRMVSVARYLKILFEIEFRGSILALDLRIDKPLQIDDPKSGL